LIALVALAACSGLPDDPASAGSPSGRPSPHKTSGKTAHIVGFGDSIPAGGGGCDCEGFVDRYGRLTSENNGRVSEVHNFAVGGSTSADVVDQLGQTAVRDALKRATTVLIMTGANDYNDAFDEASIGIDPQAVYPPVATVVQDNVTATITKIRALNSKVHVVVLDYWAAQSDGAVARRQYDVTTAAAASACTASVNTALAVAARSAGATYVSTYTAFLGKDGSRDPTALLGADGDHPNAIGQELIAQTVAEVFPDG